MEAKEFDIEFPRGDSIAINFGVNNANGEPLNILPENAEIYFTVKKTEQGSVVLQKKLSTGGITYENGIAKIFLKRTDTSNLPYLFKGVYDLTLVSGDLEKTLFIGAFNLTKEVTWANNQ